MPRIPPRPALAAGLAALLLLAAAPARAETYALLVACQEYDGKELNSLKFTRNDILAFRGALLESGVSPENIVLMCDGLRAGSLPDGPAIRQRLGELLARAGRDATVIIALSGHGVQYRGDAKHYFCPRDAKLGEPDTLIALDELYGQLSGCQARRKLLLVDACRNDPQSRVAKGPGKPRLESVTRPQEEAVPAGIVALFSCSPGQESYEHPGLRHGVFFHTVLQGWDGAADANGDGVITLNELSDYVQRETPRLAARKPLEGEQLPQQKNEVSGVWVLREPDPVGELRQFGPFNSGLRNAFLTEDGARLIALGRGTGPEDSTPDDNNVRPDLTLWDAHTGRQLRRYEIHSGVC
jgi:hypothetical protein